MKQPSWYQQPRNRMRERSVGALALIAIMAFFAVAGTIFAYYFLPNPDLLLGKGDHDTRKNKVVHVVLEDVELLIPSNLVARVKRRTLGSVRQVDMEVPWPFDPKADIVPPEEVTDRANQLMLTFQPASRQPSDAERFTGIYQPYIAGAPVRMQADLYRYSFSTSSPYADIEYYVGEIGSTTVYIKCELRPSTLGPQLCSNELKSSPKTTLRYRFARHHLAQWREIDQTARQLLLQLTHRTGDKDKNVAG